MTEAIRVDPAGLDSRTTCGVCGLKNPPTIDCECGQELGLCDGCILDYSVKCPACGEWVNA